jgi:hypothetical protein
MPGAAAELQEITEYLEPHSPEAARKLIRTVNESIGQYKRFLRRER